MDPRHGRRSGDHHHPAGRHALVAVVLALLAAGAVVALDVPPPPPAAARVDCGAGRWLTTPGQPPACVHEDEPPLGVDVTRRVPTAELVQREGAGPQAHEVAEELGVPTTPAAGVSSPAVPCDGDGSSGYRTQAMYVVEADDPNRYAALLPSLQIWAAGVDDVVNRSAALTGGVRRVRFVTDPSGGACVARVLNVTVPAGALASFGSSISALQARGHNLPQRKYLMWTDANVLCGVGSMYLDTSDAQSNANNGAYAQYARTDNGCWGLGSLAGQHSVEAHELLHTLGAVAASAPHGTNNGHCYDEQDTMCYSDGPGVTMQYVCPAAAGYLLDCRSDDYFSTFPDPGSWLDTHWNAADSRFLVGGGDGAGGGTVGTPTVLGATLSVNNPAVPGLPTQATVSPVLPSGRTVASVTWKSGRSDCVFTAPTAESTEVVCNASSAAATTVTVTVKDSTGATKTVAVPLTFSAPSSPRVVSLGLATAHQDAGDAPTASACTGVPTDVVVRVVDVASGRAVKGVRLSVTRRTATTAPVVAGSGLSTADGGIVVRPSFTVATTLSATSTAGYGFAAATPVEQGATPVRCATTLVGGASATEVWFGQPVVLSGALTRPVTVAGQTVQVPAAGARLTLLLTAAGTGRVTTLGTATVAADGTWTSTAKPTTSGSLAVTLATSTAYEPRRTELGPLTVQVPTTALTASATPLDVGYGATTRVTGRLTKDQGGVVTGVPSATVSIRVTPPGGNPVVVGSGRTLADGTFVATPVLRVAGQLSVVYAGVLGLPATSVVVGPVVVGSWATQPVITSAPASAVRGTTVTVAGTVTRSYGGATGPAPGLRVRLAWTPTGGSTSYLTSGTTTSTGAVTLRAVAPAGSGTLALVVTGVAGHLDGSSATRTFTGT